MDDHRPTITRREVSWHQVCAAIRARREAEAQGIDPEARLAMLFAATDGDARPTIVLATLWAMEETDKHLPELTAGNRYADQALLCLTLLDPERVLIGLLDDDLHDVRIGILSTLAVMTPDRASRLELWFTAEMRRLKHLAGGSAEESLPKR